MAGRDLFRDEWLTTGQVAAACGVSPRTAAKWFDRGLLKGHRLPGSRDRRVRRDDAARFAASMGLPARLHPQDLILFCLTETAVPGCSWPEKAIPVLAAAGRVRAVVLGCADGVAPAVVMAAAVRATDAAVRVGLLLSDDVPEHVVPGGVFDWVGRDAALAVAGTLGPTGAGGAA